MNHQEYIEEYPVTSRKRALRFMDRHGILHSEFFADCGDKTEYDSAEIIEWMGY